MPCQKGQVHDDADHQARNLVHGRAAVGHLVGPMQPLGQAKPPFAGKAFLLCLLVGLGAGVLPILKPALMGRRFQVDGPWAIGLLSFG